MMANLHLLEFALVVDALLDVVLDVVEGEEVVVLDDAGLGLLRVDVLQRLQDAPVAQRFVFDQHHLVDLLLPVLLGVAVLLLLLPHCCYYLNYSAGEEW